MSNDMLNTKNAVGLTLQDSKAALETTLTVVLEKAPGNWCAYAPDLEDCIIATGRTREEAIRDFRNALLDMFDARRKEGDSVPAVTHLEVREVVPITEALAA